MTRTQDRPFSGRKDSRISSKPSVIEPRRHSQELSSKVYAILRDHLAVLISGALVAFAALKIIIFARGDYLLALAVLGAGQQFTILASTMFNALTILAMLYISWSGIIKTRATPSGTFESHLQFNLKRYVPLFMAWALLLVAAPAIFIALAAFATLNNFLANSKSRRGRGKEPNPRKIAKYRLKRTRRLRIIGIITSINVVTMVVVLAATSWAPTERVTFKEDQAETTITGFVVGQQAKQVLIVRSDGGGAFWVGEDSLKRRKLCLPDDDLWEGISQPALSLISTVFESRKQIARCSVA
ncbi:hypothetical protein HP499_08110 [Paenarthrobacter sp. CM16]|uniref:hypothetical protein n=1 Tax=Paenarthrobacter sp. CM16 TaxID=2738447 RepID=UPI001557AAFD|nr:hypothetical protein [Paenarthrobacter sp. CM16]NQD87766.1 hypothetical protein [Paenarthrobacter sp. CM16]